MSEKKRPILMVLVILGIAALFLGTVGTIISFLSGPSSRFSFREKIGVIPIEGAITDSRAIISQLVEFKKDGQIKAIILRVNSPGGGVAPSQEIYREVRKTVMSKKVIASMGSLAASGGYYVASAADKIVANPGTLTGSIGVIMEFVQVEELLKKIGVGMEVIKSGEFKDIGSPHRKMSEREKELIRALILDVQKQFVEAVARGRNLPLDKVEEIADGRILSGAQAKELGLVDQLGNFEDAVDLAKSLAGIKGEITLVYPKKTRGRIWDLLLRDVTKVFYESLRDILNTRVEYRWDGLLQWRGD
ncbi:MAG: signal peptide peptidase SppA [Desulfobacterales bacterium]|nr:signal peptide peptidase SppA [Desulfobacterales bacterium]